jgi:hypothetical protein
MRRLYLYIPGYPESLLLDRWPWELEYPALTAPTHAVAQYLYCCNPAYQLRFSPPSSFLVSSITPYTNLIAAFLFRAYARYFRTSARAFTSLIFNLSKHQLSTSPCLVRSILFIKMVKDDSQHGGPLPVVLEVSLLASYLVCSILR